MKSLSKDLPNIDAKQINAIQSTGEDSNGRILELQMELKKSQKFAVTHMVVTVASLIGVALLCWKMFMFS